MNKIIACILGFLGLGARAAAQDAPLTVDPKNILFSVPTLSNDLPELHQLSNADINKTCVMHEDDWAQIEFLPKSYLPQLQNMLTEFKEYEHKNRMEVGWKNVYIRKVERNYMFQGDSSLKELADVVRSKPGTAPTIISGGTPMTYRNGFTIALGGNIALYGTMNADGISTIGACVGENPDDLKLTNAFSALNADRGLILVDWKSQLVLMAVTPTGDIDVWRP